MFVVSRTRSPLLIPELFYYVLNFLAEPCRSVSSDDDRGIRVQTPAPDGRRALATLARVCHRFREPSLNYLWRKLDSLRPLVTLFNGGNTFLWIGEYSRVSESPPDL